MNNIDLSWLVSQSDHQAEAATRHRGLIKAECRRRIFAVVDEIAQINLAAAAAADRLDPVELATYGVGLDWVEAMRAACLPLIVDPGMDPAEAANWPPAPDGVTALAAQF